MKVKSILVSAVVLLGFNHLSFASSLAENARPALTDASSSAAGNLVNDDAADQTDSAAQTNDEAASTDNYSAFGAQNEQQDNNANDNNMMDDDSTDDDSGSSDNFSGSDDSSSEN